MRLKFLRKGVRYLDRWPGEPQPLVETRCEEAGMTELVEFGAKTTVDMHKFAILSQFASSSSVRHTLPW